jgi:hypothetical protein
MVPIKILYHTPVQIYVRRLRGHTTILGHTSTAYGASSDFKYTVGFGVGFAKMRQNNR